MKTTVSKKLVSIALLAASLSAVSAVLAGTATLSGAQQGSFEAIASQGVSYAGAPGSALANYAASFEALSASTGVLTDGELANLTQPGQALSLPVARN